MNKRKIFGRLAFTGTALFMALMMAYPASAVTATPTRIVGTGSDVAWRVMSALDKLYNLSPGCNLLATPPTVQPLDESCQPDFPGAVTPTTENVHHDIVGEDAPIGGTAGVNQLCQQGTAGVGAADFARQTNAPSTSTCTGTSFVAYARDALDFEVWPKVAGSGTGTGFHNTSGTCAGSLVNQICLTQAQLQGIFVNCSITNWNQVGGTKSVPIVPYVPLPAFGTRSKWDTFLLGSTSTCITNPSHITPAETDNSFPKADATLKGAIMAVSYGSWKTRYGTKALSDGSVLGLVDKIAPTTATIQNLSFPFGRYIYNVICTACTSGHQANAATVAYVGPDGWICKSTAHTTVPFSNPAVNYRAAIANAITAAGFVNLPKAVEGSGDTNQGYCQLFTH
jgi:hypothetical protein